MPIAAFGLKLEGIHTIVHSQENLLDRYLGMHYLYVCKYTLINAVGKSGVLFKKKIIGNSVTFIQFSFG